MKYARIDQGRVAEIGIFDSIENRFHPSLVWVECPDGVAEGDVYADGQFSAWVPPAPTAEELRDRAKAARAAAVAAITVTTAAGNTFDGDEISQTRMARAIIALSAQPPAPVPTVNWVLADNSVIDATIPELTEALALAGAAQAALWVI